jgi:hypothetical protein
MDAANFSAFSRASRNAEIRRLPYPSKAITTCEQPGSEIRKELDAQYPEQQTILILDGSERIAVGGVQYLGFFGFATADFIAHFGPQINAAFLFKSATASSSVGPEPVNSYSQLLLLGEGQ